MVAVLGIAATASAVGVSFLAKEFVVRSILLDLRVSPEYFGELVETQDRFGVRDALERYLLTPAGKQAFVRRSLQGVSLDIDERFKYWLRKGHPRGLLRLTPTKVALEPSPGGAMWGLGDNLTLQGLTSLLPLLEKERVTVDDYPNVTFKAPAVGRCQVGSTHSLKGGVVIAGSGAIPCSRR